MSARHFRKVAALALVTTVGLSVAACSSSKAPATVNGVTTISVDCAPLKTDGKGLALPQWNADVKAFEKIHPDIHIESISVGTNCDTAADFAARIQAGSEADVFMGYMTDAQAVLNAGQAADITKYVTAQSIPGWNDMIPGIKTPFTVDGKLYGIPYSAYTMGLVYNTDIFKAAGLDPTKPPTTWPEVIADAKTITQKTGKAGYSDYSAGGQGGWHNVAELYSQGSGPVSADGKTATVNTPQELQVLQNLHQMAVADKSMGSKQLLTWPDLLTNAAAGKVGMFIGAPDTITSISNQFSGTFGPWAMSPMPGQSGPGAGTLAGGDGYFFNSHDTPAQIKAGIAWVNYEKLTPGIGQLNYVSAKADGNVVGLSEPQIFTPGSTEDKADQKNKAASANVTISNYTLFNNNPIKSVIEPPDAQAVYGVLDGLMAAAVTQTNPNFQSLIAKAQSDVQSQLDTYWKTAG
ncbi:MAG TPA: extracellular solute-binding protein [Micromonosporaceae bacterium]|jgi:ABC-type glycerol-3-phosphate transport system substrate-binding protein